MSHRRASQEVDGGGRSRFSGSNLPTVALLLAVALAALVVRAMVRPSHGLWYDELQSVTLAAPSPCAFDASNRLSLPIPRLVLGVLRFDPHPPLYYLQLHGWMMGGTSERWLRANSGLWLVVAAVSIMLAGRRLLDRRAGFVAACLFVVLPLPVGFSWQVRMYTLWMLEAMVAAWLNDLVLRPSNEHCVAASAGLAVVASAGYATHGAGFLLGPALVVHGLLLIRERHPQRRAITLWCLSLLAAGLTAVPWLARAALATPPIAYLEVPSARSTVRVLTSLVVGEQLSEMWPIQAITAVVWVAVVAVGAQSRGSRTLIAAYLVVPLAVCLVLSYTVSPLWHVRAVAFVVPFWCLAAGWAVIRVAQLVAEARTRASFVEAILASVLVVLAVGATLSTDLERGKLPGYREAVAFSRQAFTVDDVVLIPNPRVFWSWGWYAAGAGVVDVLDSTQVLKGPNGERILRADALAEPVVANLWMVRRLESESIAGAVQRAARSFGEVDVVKLRPAGRTQPQPRSAR